MHINDALIDAASGAVVAPGKLRIASPVPGLPEIVEHQYLLLDIGPAGLGCRAITRFDRLQSGLLKVSPIDACLWFTHLSRRVFDDMFRWSPQPDAWKMQFAGDRCGSLAVGPHSRQVGIVTAVEIRQSSELAGRAFSIDGTMVTSGTPTDSSASKASAILFSIYGTIPWATVRILGLAGSYGYQKHLPKAPEQPGIPASPIPRAVSSLESLRSTGDILGSITDPTYPASDMLLAGSIELTSGKKEPKTPARQVVRLNLSERVLSIRDADRAILHSDGFCSPLRSYFGFTITCLNVSFISGLLGVDGIHATANMSGSGLGWVNYDTGLGASHGNPLGNILQDIMFLELTMDATHSGVEIRIKGVLQGFRDEYASQLHTIFEREAERLGESYRRVSEPIFAQLMKPWSDFSIRADLPWMWLLIRRSTLARFAPRSDDRN